MKPEKDRKKRVNYVLYAVALVIVLFVAAHLACAFTEANMAAADAENAVSTFSAAFDLFSERITSTPFALYRCDNTMQFIGWGIFIWAMAVLMIENQRRNYIRGKEYGTAHWATERDIKDLYAESICREEIRKARQVQTKAGRRRAKAKAYRNCEADGAGLERSKMNALAMTESARKIEGTYSRKQHAEDVRNIKEEVKRSVDAAKIEAWEPNRIERDYQDTLSDIENDPFLSRAEKADARKKAEGARDRKLKEFYSSAKRIEKTRMKYHNADMLFTKTERISLYNYKLNNNTLILGGSGSGKTRGYVMPNILQAHSSYIVTDPKGEILEKAGYYLSEVEGYKIRVLNLDNKTASDCYNPFDYLHPERDGYEERVLSLIETIIINTDGGEKKSGSDPFWDKAERLFLQAIFFFVSDGFVPEERNMNTVMELIKMLRIEEDQDNFDSDLDVFAEMFKERFGPDNIGVQQYEEFRQKASGRTAKSIVISAVARLAPFKTKEVRRIFAKDNMCLEDVGEEKTAIFVVVPPTDSTFNFIAGMLFTQLFQELQYCATQVHKHDGQRLPVPCRFILDEFANTCTIPNFVKILAYARSFGIGITVILQSLEQIKNMYKDEWGVIVDNCNTLLFLGSITHMDTLEYMSKLLGKGTFDKKTSGHSRGSHGSSTENFDVIGRELMTADEIRKMDKNDCLFIVGGRPPFYSEKYHYESHPNYRYTSDGNAAYTFTYVPAELPDKAGDTAESGSVDREPEKEVVHRPLPEAEAVRILSDEESLRYLTEHIDTMRFLDTDEDELAEMTPEEQEAFMDEFIDAIMNDGNETGGLADVIEPAPEHPAEDVHGELERAAAEHADDFATIITDPIEIMTELTKRVRTMRFVSDDVFDEDYGDPENSGDADGAPDEDAIMMDDEDETEALEALLDEAESIKSAVENFDMSRIEDDMDGYDEDDED